MESLEDLLEDATQQLQKVRGDLESLMNDVRTEFHGLNLEIATTNMRVNRLKELLDDAVAAAEFYRDLAKRTGVLDELAGRKIHEASIYESKQYLKYLSSK